mgnify:CR=1 FL=1
MAGDAGLLSETDFNSGSGSSEAAREQGCQTDAGQGAGAGEKPDEAFNYPKMKKELGIE